jgi:hypothetical protein
MPDPAPTTEAPAATPQAADVAPTTTPPPGVEGTPQAASEAVAAAAPAKTVSQKERERLAFLDRSQRRAARDREAAGLAARQREAAEAQVTAANKRAEEAEAKIASYRKDPIVAAAKDGIDVAPSISSFVSETAPEKLIKEQNERIARLEQERIDDRKKNDTERAAALEQSVVFNLHAVADGMSGNPGTFPYTVAVWEPDEVRAHMRALHAWSKSSEGRPVQIAEATAYIEKIAKMQYEKRKAKEAHLRAAAQTPPASATETPAEAGRNGQTSGNRPPSNARASSGPVTRTPQAPTKRLSRTQQREQEAAADLAAIRAATAKDRLATNGAPAKAK